MHLSFSFSSFSIRNNKLYPLLCIFSKFWNRYYFVGPALWEVRSASLLLYSSRARGYSRGMISSGHQWPTEVRAFIARCFSFRKNIVSFNPRGVAALVASSYFIALRLLAKSSTSRRNCMYTMGKCFQRITSCAICRTTSFSFIMRLCNGKMHEFYPTFLDSLHFFSSTNIIYCTKIYREE